MAKLIPRLTVAQERFGAVFWGHISACVACTIKLADLKGEINGLLMREFAEKMCPVALELVDGFEKSQKAQA